MLFFVIGLVVFLGIHSLSIVSRDFRNRLVERLGPGAFKGVYSLISIAGFVLLVWGYGQARQAPVVLFHAPVWIRHLVWLLMAPVFPLLLAMYLPGKIQSKVKHPMLTAVKTWALAHLLANGTLADLLLFGGFLAWAVVDRISVKGRPDTKAPVPRGWGLGDAIAIIAGLGLYAAFFLWLHPLLIGVAVR
ncbi:MAG: NnrU family protein [Deltaproteobacteria bacterium]|nr:NnrU family protein [Deltaproteobacteria bacterium]